MAEEDVQDVECPRVSIVIPNYWDGDIVGETLRSIREDERIEVVVVDDASPDEDVAGKLERLRDLGLIDVLVLKPVNAGVAAAVNDGVNRASGRYVFCFGNDDLLKPGILGRLADLLDEHPEAGFASGGYQCFGSRSHAHVAPSWDPWKCLYRNLWSAAVMVRREIYLEIGGYTDATIFQDWDLYMEFAERGILGCVLPEPTYYYRVHATSRMWRSARRNWRFEYRTLRARHRQLFASERQLRHKSGASPVERWWYRGTAFVLEHAPGAVAELIFRVVQDRGPAATAPITAESVGYQREPAV